ncbi:L-seryl-tRNA(Sec) selenium transferase [Desulfovibrio sp. TomC]|uniref:L-seryl-tRNA(Sec) selenium transferase n=1 Tax=Desulfovibrio sp. TomC TaxID=1562888 RepID=UPI0005754C78|nr:L-seryl-tRNA(Sec) selenium transferase [Desulfovibrio sp. TomC]KHK00525.1 L-seryl-tRNA(Sec) selenium transferase [Desulfovibrio sp. TomC]
MQNFFRLLPPVDAVLAALDTDPSLAALPRAMLRDAVTSFLDGLREDIRAGRLTDPVQLDHALLFAQCARSAAAATRPHFRRVINATGVVVHTNLGRSLLAPEAATAAAEACLHYSNLEFDLTTGERGSRYSHVLDILRTLTGAEDALVVNNNAAAVLITLETLAKGREVVVSRGQLVEIGGSFRIPEIMAKSGAILREVGATNRTHPRDYENAVTPETAALLKVHTSNYRIVGFTKEVSLAELVPLGRRHNLPVIEDLGSGNLTDFTSYGLPGEPTVQQAVADGADVVTFSGDKVLGGPQAGIIVGRAKYIAAIRKNPLNRAIRIDKMTLAALEATLRLYRDPERARTVIPTVAMITAAPQALAKKARKLASLLKKSLAGRYTVGTIPGASRVGGGAFPERDLPTTLVALSPLAGAPSPDALRARLLTTDPPLVARTQDDALLLDPRTLADDELKLVSTVLGQALGE